MTPEKHKTFKIRIGKAMTTITDHILGRKTATDGKLKDAIDTLNELQIEYDRTQRTLRDISSKIHHYKQGR